VLINLGCPPKCHNPPLPPQSVGQSVAVALIVCFLLIQVRYLTCGAAGYCSLAAAPLAQL